MNQSGIPDETTKLTWQERYGHLPWFRRYEFLIPAYLAIFAIMVFLLPGKSIPTWPAMGQYHCHISCLYHSDYSDPV